MATKASLLTALDTFISAVGRVTKARHTDANDLLVDNGYSSIITESYTNLATTATNTTAIGTTHYYTTYWIKQGRLVTVFGTITNKTGSSTSNEDYITINVGEFTPQVVINEFIAHSTSDNRNVRCRVTGNVIQVRSALANNESISFQFNYFSKD